jgi:hypothetical protein
MVLVARTKFTSISGSLAVFGGSDDDSEIDVRQSSGATV